VHLVARFGRSITQADWVKELKRVSSLWLNDTYGIEIAAAARLNPCGVDNKNLP